ncbi:MAG: DoxX family protein [Bacteroidota bacterium]
MKRLNRIHTTMGSASTVLQHPLLLLVRLYWGYDFFQTGLGKLNNLERTAEFFASLDIPFPYFSAAAAGSTEIVCGVLLMIGLASRYAALPLIVILSMAYATDDYEALSNILTDVESFVDATPFRHLLASLIVLAFGAGKISIDAFISSYFKKSGEE